MINLSSCLYEWCGTVALMHDTRSMCHPILILHCRAHFCGVRRPSYYTHVNEVMSWTIPAPFAQCAAVVHKKETIFEMVGWWRRHHRRLQPQQKVIVACHTWNHILAIETCLWLTIPIFRDNRVCQFRSRVVVVERWRTLCVGVSLVQLQYR